MYMYKYRCTYKFKLKYYLHASVVPYLTRSHYDSVQVLGGGHGGWCSGGCQAIELCEVLGNSFPLQREGDWTNVLIHTQKVLVF